MDWEVLGEVKELARPMIYSMSVFTDCSNLKINLYIHYLHLKEYHYFSWPVSSSPLFFLDWSVLKCFTTVDYLL